MRSPVAVLCLVLLATSGLAAAGTAIVRSYEAGALNLQVSLLDPTGAMFAECVTSDCSIDLGGVAMALPGGSRLVDIVVRDEASADARALACQDTDLDNVCGEAGEPGVQFCNSLAERITDNGVPFGAGVLRVFVFATPVRVSAANPASSGVVLCPDGGAHYATRGEVTVLLEP